MSTISEGFSPSSWSWNHDELGDKVMAFDNQKHAGNEGDVVKHVALFAALRGIVRPGGRAFRYADLYAGYAQTELPKKGKGGWENGIGKVEEKLAPPPQSNLNPDVLDWANTYVLPAVELGRPYPGSVMLARDVIRAQKRQSRLAVWDVEPEPLRSLVEFGREGTDTRCVVHCHSAEVSEPELREADFLFLDPPDMKHCKSCMAIVKAWKKDFLLWLPVFFNDNQSCGKGIIRVRKDAGKLGCHTTFVQWNNTKRKMNGCELVYGFDDSNAVDKLRNAVNGVVSVLGWSVKHHDPP
jgi:23S rRNA A2030 N6-methylase RlmJ